MTQEQLVLDYLRGEGAYVVDAERMLSEHQDYPHWHNQTRKCFLSASRALLVCAAIRIGFTFKARGNLAPACEYQGRAAIGGTVTEPASSDPWWCLVNFVEAAQ